MNTAQRRTIEALGLGRHLTTAFVISLAFVTMLVLAVVGCTEPTLHPCEAAENCVLQNGVSTCTAGTVWEKRGEKDNFTCVAPPDVIREWNLPNEGGNPNIGWAGASGVGRDDGAESYTLFDFNGDALTDLVVTARGQPTALGAQAVGLGMSEGSPHWLVYFGTGRGFEEDALRVALPEGGRGDFGFAYTSGRGDSLGEDWWTTFDINGDLRPDLVLTAQVQSSPNGDEVRVFGRESSYWLVHYNTGFGFEPDASRFAVPEGGMNGRGFVYTWGGGGNSLLGSESWVLRDMTGDGVLDILVTSRMEETEDGVQERGFGFEENDPHWIVYPNQLDGFGF